MTDLERRLADLADDLDVPRGEGLAAAVTTRLVAEPEPHRRGWRRWKRWIAGAVIVGAGAGAAPALGDWLGIGGVAVHRETPPPGPTLRVDPGRPVELDEVRSIAGFEPLMPEVLGGPDAVWVDDGASPLVWLRWDDGPLLTQVEADDRPVLHKYAAGAAVEAVEVDGHRALWVDGPHHLVLDDADRRGPAARYESAGTLLIELESVTVRIETGAGLAEAVRIARSLPGT